MERKDEQTNECNKERKTRERTNELTKERNTK